MENQTNQPHNDQKEKEKDVEYPKDRIFRSTDNVSEDRIGGDGSVVRSH